MDWEKKESAVAVLSGCQEVFMYVSIFTFVVLVVSNAVDLTGGNVRGYSNVVSFSILRR